MYVSFDADAGEVAASFFFFFFVLFFLQAEDGIRDLVRSRGLGDVYKRQGTSVVFSLEAGRRMHRARKDFASDSRDWDPRETHRYPLPYHCLLYTSDAADERSSVALGGRRIIKNKNQRALSSVAIDNTRSIRARKHSRNNLD